jgi:hypothetical protein
MNILTFYGISKSQITHFKTRIKTPAPCMAGDPRFFSNLLGKKHFPPPPPLDTCWLGWRGVRVGWVGWLAGLAGWLGWLVGWVCWVDWLAGLAGLAGW